MPSLGRAPSSTVPVCKSRFSVQHPRRSTDPTADTRPQVRDRARTPEEPAPAGVIVNRLTIVLSHGEETCLPSRERDLRGAPPLRKLNGRKSKNSAWRAFSRGLLPFHFPSRGTLRPSAAQEDRFAWQRGGNEERDRARRSCVNAGRSPWSGVPLCSLRGRGPRVRPRLVKRPWATSRLLSDTWIAPAPPPPGTRFRPRWSVCSSPPSEWKRECGRGMN